LELVRTEGEREVEFDGLLRRGAGREAAGLEEREGAWDRTAEDCEERLGELA